MGEAIGQILPLAVGVALSPVPIIAVALRPRRAGGTPQVDARDRLVHAGAGLPVAVYFLMGDGAPKVLAEMKDWFAVHNTVIMVVLCVVIAAKLVGDGITGLTA
jgi:hypothetical protein